MSEVPLYALLYQFWGGQWFQSLIQSLILLVLLVWDYSVTYFSSFSHLFY